MHTHSTFSCIDRHMRSPTPIRRSPSPRRGSQHQHPHDVGFSDAVSDVIDLVKYDHVSKRDTRIRSKYHNSGSTLQ